MKAETKAQIKAEDIEQLRSGYILRCALVYHKWTPWALSSGHFSGAKEERVIQERRCLLCNFYECRGILYQL